MFKPAKRIRKSIYPYTCAACGKEGMSIYPGQTYCSRACLGSKHKEIHTATKVCAHCGASFVGNKVRQYCSKGCQYAAKKLRAKTETIRHRLAAKKLPRLGIWGL